jgi:hypothetical protein
MVLSSDGMNGKYSLNMERGITNIGSHPDNDIVIQDARVLPFHLMLDHRQKPYRVIALSPQSNISVNGVAVSSGEPIEVMDLSLVKFNGFSLSTPSANGGSNAGSIVILPPVPAAATIPVAPVLPPESSKTISTPAASGALSAAASITRAIPGIPLPPAREDDIIILNLAEPRSIIDVEQSAVYKLSIVNGGPIVATFDVAVAGVPDGWVEILPRKVNLNESGRASVEIRITPPRESASRAGDYALAITVTSPNYLEHSGQVNAQLTINPYYQFAVGNLNPRQRSASWSKRSGAVSYPIFNQGNSQAGYQISALDDENGLQFEFPQENQTSLARQTEVRVDAGTASDVPLVINPIKRSLIRLRGRHYNYNIKTQSMVDETSAQTVSGTFISQPLFGLIHLILAAIIVLVGGYFLLRPRIIEFSASKDVIETGQPVTLKWRTSLFTTDLSIEGVNDKVTGSQNQMDVTPTSTATTYTLVASNWLSKLLRMENIRSDPVTVLMIPTSPVITTFSVDKTDIFEGDTVNLKWSVSNAEQVYLTVDGVTDSLAPDKFNGEKAVVLHKDSLIIMEAKNSSGSLVKSEFVKARKPAITIDEFTLSKTTITEGDPVTIKWKVSGTGVESVNISPFTDPLPLQGELTFFPKESMEFVMSVKNRDLEEIRLLPVGVMAPGAAPTAPTINFFKAAPQSMTGSGTTEFSWSVSGVTNKIEITDADGVIKSGLAAQGFLSASVSKTTNYVLTAYNNTISTASILEVTVNPSLTNVQVQIHSTVPSTSLTRGDSVLVYYTVKPIKNGVAVDDVITAGLPEPSGKVVVTDGYDTCEAELPQKSCSITLNTSSPNKQLTATYSGDGNYTRRTSDPYPTTGLTVVGQPTKFLAKPAISSTSLVTGQPTTVSFTLTPSDSTKTDRVTGNVEVWEIDGGMEVSPALCTATLQSVVNSTNQATGSCDIVFNKTGSKSIRVKYMGNQVYDGVTMSSPELDYINVTPAGTTTSITSNASTVSTVVGEPLDVKVLVQATSPGSGTPTGQVRIYDTASGDDCHATLSNGIGDCQIAFSRNGARSIVATYITDTNYAGSSSAPVNHTVNKASTTPVITSITPAGAQVGQAVTISFYVGVDSPGSGTPSGTVNIYSNNIKICTVTPLTNVTYNGSSYMGGSCNYTVQTSGPKLVQAQYTGDASFSSGTSVYTTYTTNKAATSVSITAQNPTPSAIGEDVVISFAASTVASTYLTPTGSVLVSASTGESCTGALSGTPAIGSCTINFSTEGSRSLTAQFIENDNYSASQSASATQIVKRGSSITLINMPSDGYINNDITISFSVHAASASSTDIPTGNVHIKAVDTVSGVENNCDAVLSNYQGSCKISFSKPGTKRVTAVYEGDTVFTGSASNPANILINKGSTTTVLTTTATAPYYAGQSVPFTVTLTSPQTPIQYPTGVVTISSGPGGPTCTITDRDAGVGSCSLTFTSIGSYSVTASYPETELYTASDSSATPITIQVDKGNTTTTITKTSLTDPPVGVVGQSITVFYQVSIPGSSVKITDPSNIVKISASDSIGTEACSGPLTDGSGYCIINFTNIGSDSQKTRKIQALYPNTANFNTSHSADYPITINPSPTNVALSTLPEPSAVGELTTIGFTVEAANPGGGIPKTGTVTVIGNDGTGPDVPLCNAKSFDPTTGKGSCTYTFDHKSTWTIKANYTGDTAGNYLAFTDTVGISHTVSAADTTTAMGTISPNEAGIHDTTVTFNFSVTAPLSGIVAPTGIVHIKGKLSTDTTGTYQTLCSTTAANPLVQDATVKNRSNGSCTYAFDSYGTWNIYAEFAGDDDFKPSDTLTNPAAYNVIGYPVTISVAAPSYPQVNVPQNYTVTVSKTNSAVLSGEVQISATDGNTTIGPTSCGSLTVDTGGNSGQVACSLTLSSTGSWSVTARYLGNSDYAPAVSTPITAIVKISSTTSVSGPTSVDPNVANNFSMSVSHTDGTDAPTGSISFTAMMSGADTMNGSCTIGAAVPPEIPCDVIPLTFTTPGTWIIYASYSGDDNYAVSTSGPFNVTVRTPTTLSISPNPSTPIIPKDGTSGINVTYTITLSGITYPDTGSISVTPPSGKTCSPAFAWDAGHSVYSGSCTINYTAVGPYIISGSYSGNSSYGASSTSNTVNVAQGS